MDRTEVHLVGSWKPLSFHKQMIKTIPYVKGELTRGADRQGGQQRGYAQMCEVSRESVHVGTVAPVGKALKGKD